MTITYRLLKGSPLTAQELDTNFRDLETRVEFLENLISQGHQGGIKGIRLEGRDLLFENQHGETLGQVSLPLPQFRPTGVWKSQTLYAPHDLCVGDTQATYCCLKAHTSSQTFEQDQAHWEIIFKTF